jgi:hypothetical protein
MARVSFAKQVKFRGLLSGGNELLHPSQVPPTLQKTLRNTLLRNATPIQAQQGDYTLCDKKLPVIAVCRISPFFDFQSALISLAP